uniref:Uncharacterized protein n=1 Tax=Panagrolaimus sp. JU765 TaxID=591449 RepID=A0AC34REY4_9BILA
MKLFIFVLLGCFSIVFVDGFTFGVDKPKGCKSDYGAFWPAKFVGKYTNWPNFCAYKNRITIECTTKVNSSAILQLWDFDPLQDDFLDKYPLTHIEPDGKRGYFDVIGHTVDFLANDGDSEREVELYFYLWYPCVGYKHDLLRIRNILLDYHYIKD